MGRYLTKSAAILFLIRTENNKKQVLLQLRKNVWASGMWDGSASGHVEEGEPMTTALIRETKEEIGVTIKKEDIIFINIQHNNNNNNPYYNGYFFVEKFTGTPQICEPEKCGDLNWFNIDDLPGNLLTMRKQAITDLLNNITYSESDWD